MSVILTQYTQLGFSFFLLKRLEKLVLVFFKNSIRIELKMEESNKDGRDVFLANS